LTKLQLIKPWLKLCKGYTPYNAYGGTSDSCQYYVDPICQKNIYEHHLCPWLGYGYDELDFNYHYEHSYLTIPKAVIESMWQRIEVWQ